MSLYVGDRLVCRRSPT